MSEPRNGKTLKLASPRKSRRYFFDEMVTELEGIIAKQPLRGQFSNRR